MKTYALIAICVATAMTGALLAEQKAEVGSLRATGTFAAGGNSDISGNLTITNGDIILNGQSITNLFGKATEKYVLFDREGTALGNSYGLDNFTLVADNNKIKVADRIELKADLSLFYRMSDLSVSAYGLHNTWLDKFVDQTGVDVTRSTGEYYGSRYYENIGTIGYGTPYCVYLDGADDNLRLAMLDTIQPLANGSFSVSCWFQVSPSLVSGYGCLWQLSGNALAAHYMNMTYGAAVTGWTHCDDAGNNLFNYAWTANTNWHHMVLTMTNTAGGVVLWFDGAAVASANGYAYTNGANRICVGARLNGSGTAADTWFRGYVDQVIVYDRAISGADVTNLYAAGSGLYYDGSSAFNGGKGIYELQENTGTNVVDSSGLTNTGYFGGAPTWSVGKKAAPIYGNVVTNMFLYSTNFPVVATPTNFRVAAYLENVSNVTINTDFYLQGTRDGTNWAIATLSRDGTISGAVYCVSGTGSFSGPAHTNVGLRAVATNNMDVKVHGWHIAVE